MTAPEDQNGLREALARAKAERDEADRRAGAAERKHACGLDVRLKMTEARREMKIARGYDESVSFDRVWAETCALADRALAAEAEITRLKEGMEAAVGALRKRAAEADDLAAETKDLSTWQAGELWGRALAFREVIDLATLKPKEPSHG